MSRQRSFAEYEDRRRAEHGTKYDGSRLNPALVRYFESGERVRVDMGRGVTLTGTIGATTGWRPCFLLMRTSRAIGSPWTLEHGETVTAVKVGRRYQEVSHA